MALSASGFGPAVPVPHMTMAMALLHIASGEGSFGGGQGLAVWLQVSDDEGLTWYDLPLDQSSKTSASGTNVVADTHKRNLSGTTVHQATGAHQFFGLIRHLVGKTIRAAWSITGTGPLFAFEVALVGK